MLTNIFGLPIKYEDWNRQNILPLYLVASYKFLNAYIAKQRCIMLVPLDGLDTLPALKKQITKIKAVDDVPVVLNLKSISIYRRNSLIEHQIPFVTEKQAYLPFLGALLTNENEKEELRQVEKFVFSTQQLFLLYLYRNEKQLYVSEATRTLPFSAMTLSRAAKQLEASGLFFVTKDGVNKVIESSYDRSELFEKGLHYLSSPVRRFGYIDRDQITKDMVLAGESALAAHTMLNPNKIETYAVSEKNFDKSALKQELVDPKKQVKLEVWAYDPKQFVKDGIADSLSVVLSFLESRDERIEEAVEQLKERTLG